MREEIICLYSLIEISKKGLISNNYNFCDDYEEWSVCINKDNNTWQAYLCEKRKKYELDKFKDIKNTCIKVIWYCSYNKEELEIAIQSFLTEVIKVYSSSEEKINKFKDEYLYIRKKKK